MAKSKKDSCKRGVSCGLSCIAGNKDCIKEFPPKLQPYVEELAKKYSNSNLSEKSVEVFKSEELAKKLSNLPETKQRMVAEMALLIMGTERDKADKFAFSPEEISGMQDRAKELDDAYEVSYRSEGKVTPESLRRKGGVGEYLEKTRTENISEEDVEVMWDVLPRSVKKTLTVSGALKKGNFWKPKEGTDPLDESQTPDPKGGNQSEERGKLLLKIYMRQGGKDIYTGQPLPLLEADLEHVVPFEMGGKASEDPANWGWTRTGINAGRGKRDIGEYIKTNVTKRLGLESLDQKSSEAKPSNLKKVEKDFEKISKANKIRKQAKKDLESADWINTPSSEWSSEQREIFSRMNKSLNDPSMKKGYYLIEKIAPDFSSTASIHPIKRSSRRKVWLQELGVNATEETLNLWASSPPEGKKKIEKFWKETGPMITEEIKGKGLYSEESSKEAMNLSREIVKRELSKIL